ncbi:DUF4188 domain-containing protein [Urbifossiella limnaea]|uniref:DUF4188 domain-containing protein n=1 Tax=Urbifossiella limnaea TaxID=2528023 RepID=A0A517XQ56_9BACT|nr:DUF4188 domain-containing protein [Urbifossiella limnaea]QDU19634.1 hypothetical protein ETAA1_15640 [Urbifossiella limnaea]
MGRIHRERLTVRVEGPFVVFLVGMRINKPWKIHKWLPVLWAMRRMLRELASRPEAGCLGYFSCRTTVVQYWRSFVHLEAYARSRDSEHWPAWVAFNRRMAGCRGDVGIWHETYLVPAGGYEAIYSGMPPHGLGRVGELVPVAERTDGARLRLGGEGRPAELYAAPDPARLNISGTS